MVGLDGTHVQAHLSAVSGAGLKLLLDLRINPGTDAVGGLVHGTRA